LQDVAQKVVKSSQHKFTKAERLADRKKRLLIIEQGRTLRYKNMLISIYPQEHWELALAIKSHCGTACDRNRLKRKVREAFRLSKDPQLQSAAIAITLIDGRCVFEVKELRDILKANLRMRD